MLLAVNGIRRDFVRREPFPGPLTKITAMASLQMTNEKSQILLRDPKINRSSPNFLSMTTSQPAPVHLPNIYYTDGRGRLPQVLDGLLD